MKACCKYPAYKDPEGKERIFDTRWDLIEEGIFPANSDLTFEEMKEALDSPCILGNERKTVKGVSDKTEIIVATMSTDLLQRKRQEQKLQ